MAKKSLNWKHGSFLQPTAPCQGPVSPVWTKATCLGKRHVRIPPFPAESPPHSWSHLRTFSEASLGSRWRKISGSCSKDGNSHGTFFTFLPNGDLSSHFSAGWWLSPTPLKNDGVRQLGWWNSQYMESHNPFMFQTTNQSVILRRMEFQSLAPAVGNAHCSGNMLLIGIWAFSCLPENALVSGPFQNDPPVIHLLSLVIF